MDPNLFFKSSILNFRSSVTFILCLPLYLLIIYLSMGEASVWKRVETRVWGNEKFQKEGSFGLFISCQNREEGQWQNKGHAFNSREDRHIQSEYREWQMVTITMEENKAG